MTLHTPINDVGHNPYCGPTAIAALTGEPVSAIYKKIRRLRGDGDRRRFGKVVLGGNVKRYDGRKRPIVGMYTGEVVRVMERFGRSVIKRSKPGSAVGGTLQQLCEDRAHLGPHIIEVTGHFIAMSRGMVCDTYRRTPVPWQEHPLLRRKVVAWWQYNDKPQPVVEAPASE